MPLLTEEAEIKCSTCGMMVLRTSELYYKCPRCGNTGLIESIESIEERPLAPELAPEEEEDNDDE